MLADARLLEQRRGNLGATFELAIRQTQADEAPSATAELSKSNNLAGPTLHFVPRLDLAVATSMPGPEASGTPAAQLRGDIDAIGPALLPTSVGPTGLDC